VDRKQKRVEAQALICSGYIRRDSQASRRDQGDTDTRRGYGIRWSRERELALGKLVRSICCDQVTGISAVGWRRRREWIWPERLSEDTDIQSVIVEHRSRRRQLGISLRRSPSALQERRICTTLLMYSSHQLPDRCDSLIQWKQLDGSRNKWEDGRELYFRSYCTPQGTSRGGLERKSERRTRTLQSFVQRHEPQQEAVI
jgi:hypothetical protein